VHGYGASGMIFYLILKRLSEKYHIVCLDLLGMGRSSRPRFRCRTAEEAEDFFVLSLEKWREEVGLDNLVLCSHSFGGYISGRYALRFSTHVKKIIFISSLGIDRVPDNPKRAVKRLMNRQPCLNKSIF
jgi:pimeloyl-ACP methyl ester carboxylesterase